MDCCAACEVPVASGEQTDHLREAVVSIRAGERQADDLGSVWNLNSCNFTDLRIGIGIFANLMPVEHVEFSCVFFSETDRYCWWPCKQWDKLPTNWCRISSYFFHQQYHCFFRRSWSVVSLSSQKTKLTPYVPRLSRVKPERKDRIPDGQAGLFGWLSIAKWSSRMKWVRSHLVILHPSFQQNIRVELDMLYDSDSYWSSLKNAPVLRTGNGPVVERVVFPEAHFQLPG